MSRKNLILGIGFIACATFLAYLPALSGGFLWDDTMWLTENRELGSWKSLLKFWTDPLAFPEYYPLTRTSFWLEYQLLQLKPLGYHLTNVILHAMNALLFWAVLAKLSVPGSWLASAIFALHPVHAESVAWITERKNVLSCFFYLAASLAYFWRARPSPRFYFLSLGLFICALLSKTVTCTFPLAVLILLMWKRDQFTRHDLFRLAPFFGIGFAMGRVTLWVERYQGRNEALAFTWSFGERCLIAGKALWFYAGKLIWPAKLMLIYPKWEIHAGNPWQSFYALSLFLVGITLWLGAKRLGKGPLAAFLFFGITLAPTLGFFNLSSFHFSFVEDHFQYHASLGLIALFAASFTRLLKIPDSFDFSPFRLRLLIPAAILASLGLLTYQRATLFRDEVALWRDSVKKNPLSAKAEYTLGLALQKRGELVEAEIHYRKALRIQADYVDSHNNLAVILTGEGKLEEAIQHLNQALKIRPDNILAHTNLGIALVKQGKLDEAIRHFSEVVRSRPDFIEGQANLKIAFDLKQEILQQQKADR